MKKIKRKRLILLSVTTIVLITLMMIIGWSQIAFAQKIDKVYKWKMQTHETASSLGPQVTIPAFCNRIKAMSNGRIEITFFTAGQLVPVAEIVNGLAKGTIDIAFTTLANYMGAIPESALGSAGLPPLIFEEYDDAIRVYWKMGVDEVIREAYAKNGVYFLGSQPHADPVSFWSKRPMRGVADLKGFKFRSFGYYAKTFAKLGASPAMIPHEEVYLAMAQGILDGSMTGSYLYKSNKYYEVAPYFYLPGAGLAGCEVLVSLKSWNELPNDLKEIVKEAFVHYSIDHSNGMWWVRQGILGEFDKMKATAITWPPEEMQKVREAGLDFLSEIANKSPGCDKGIKIIKEFMKIKGYIK